jgi:hypothetical protein
MINEPGHPTGRRTIPEEIPMLKTISAALLAISVLAAPAMAAGIAKDNVKTTPVAKTVQAPVINAVKAKPSVLNANAKMGRHHHRFHRHHRFHKHFHKHMGHKYLGHKYLGHAHAHKHMGANKPNHFAKVQLSKVTVKHVKTAIKRG